MTNITGEKLSVNQVISAFQNVSERSGLIPAHFKAEADSQNSRYVFRVEFTCKIDTVALRKFLDGLDRHLKEINIE